MKSLSIQVLAFHFKGPKHTSVSSSLCCSVPSLRCWLFPLQDTAHTGQDFCIAEYNATDQIVNAILVREAPPQTRYDTLLSSKNYDKALLVANEFKFESQMVHLQQIKGILEEIPQRPNYMDDLLSAVTVATDDYGTAIDVIKLCIEAHLPSSDDIQKLFIHFHDWINGIKSIYHEQLPTALVECHELISSTRYRWTTFQLLYMPDFKNILASFNYNLWRDFRQANLVDVMTLLLKQGSIPQAVVLWRRHADTNLIENMNKLLKLLPANIPAKAIGWWLKDEVSVAFKLHSSSAKLLEEMANWLYERAISCAENGNIEEGLIFSGILSDSIAESIDTMKHFGVKFNETNKVVAQMMLKRSFKNKIELGHDKPSSCLDSLRKLHTQLQHIKYMVLLLLGLRGNLPNISFVGKRA